MEPRSEPNPPERVLQDILLRELKLCKIYEIEIAGVPAEFPMGALRFLWLLMEEPGAIFRYVNLDAVAREFRTVKKTTRIIGVYSQQLNDGFIKHHAHVRIAVVRKLGVAVCKLR